MKKRVIIFAMVLCLTAALLAGCTSVPASPVEATPTAATTASPATASPSPVEGEDAESAGLPLSDTLAELDVWAPWGGNVGLPTVLTTFNDSLGFKEIEKNTNVHVNWDTPTSGTERETFMLLIASQLYPDIIMSFSGYYTNGIENAVDLSIALKLDDIIESYMPNYKARVDSFEDGWRKVTTDSGYIATINYMTNEPEAPWAGLAIRQDWLNELGLTVPETYSELHDVLTAFKGIETVTAPMTLYSNGDTMLMQNMAAGYGAIQDMIQKNGKVVYGPTLGGYRDYVEMMSNWYAEGLIDTDFVSRDPFGDAPAMYFSDKIGFMWGFTVIGSYEELNGQAADPDYLCVGVSNPVINKGDKCTLGSDVSAISAMGTVITESSEKQELAARWLDYLYTDEAAMLLSYGVEGVTFEYDSNGEPMLIAKYMEDYYGQPFSTCRQCNGLITGPFFRLIYKNRALINSDEGLMQGYITAGNEWLKSDATDRIPQFVAMTAEEGTEYTAIMSDVNTRIQEIVVKVILGSEPIEAFDDAIVQLSSMNIDRAVEIRQASLDRYYAR